jgi:hypothetical protein
LTAQAPSVSAPPLGAETLHKLTVLSLRAAAVRNAASGPKALIDRSEEAMDALDAEYKARRAVLERDRMLAVEARDAEARRSASVERAFQVAVVAALSSAGVQLPDMGHYILAYDAEGDVTGFADVRTMPPKA